jgi:hypothetical protein
VRGGDGDQSVVGEEPVLAFGERAHDSIWTP